MRTRTKKLVSLLLSVVMMMTLLPSMAFAEEAVTGGEKQITLHAEMTATASDNTTYLRTQKGGTVDQTQVSVSENGTVGTLPTPTPPTGWEFIGWYDKEVKTMWWNDTYGGTYNPFKGGNEPDGFKGLKNLRSSGGKWDPNSCYWSYLVGSAGNKVESGQSANGVTDLYAAYRPTSVTIKFWYNGWNNKTAALSCTRDYGSSTTNLDPGEWGSHKFTGWYTRPNPNDEGSTAFDVNGQVFKNTDVYAHWEGMETGEGKQEYSEPTGIKISPASVRVDPNKENAKVSATIFNDGKYRSDVSKIKWSIVSGGDKITISANNEWCAITGKAEGTAVVKAEVTNKANQTFTDTCEVTVAHIYSGNATVEKYPNCTEGGTGYIVCSVCGYKKNLTWEPEGHRFVSHSYYATCTEAGHTERVCRVCGVHESGATIQALGHNYSTKTIISCTGRVTTSTCTRCGISTTTSDTNSGQHSWNTYKTVDKAATCSANGSQSIHCKNCSVTKDTEVIKATGNHTYGNWVVTKPATTEQEGLQERTCTVCGNKETQDIAKLLAVPDNTSSNSDGEISAIDPTTGNHTTADSETVGDDTTTPTPSTPTDPVTPDNPTNPNPQDTPTTPEKPNDSAVKVPVTGSSGSVSATVSGSTVTVTDMDVKTSDGAVSLNLSGMGDQSINSVNLPSESVKGLANGTNVSLNVKLDTAQVNFDSAALKSIVSQASGSDIQVRADKITKNSLNDTQKKAVSKWNVNDAIDVSLLSNGKTVSNFGKGIVTVSIPYTLSAGQDKNGLSVWYVSEDGALVKYPASYANNALTFATNHFSDYIVAYEQPIACQKNTSCPVSQFEDVNVTQWYHDGIHYMFEKGLMVGTDEGFQPTIAVTRAMAIQTLYAIAGHPQASDDSQFLDVPAKIWYAKAVNWAVANGITAGVGDGNFAPDKKITRQELAAMLYKAAKSPKLYGDLSAFSDASQVASWAKDAVLWAINYGIISGTSSGNTSAVTLSPAAEASRAQAAVMMMQFTKRV